MAVRLPWEQDHAGSIPAALTRGDVRELVNPTDCESAKGGIETRTLPQDVPAGGSGARFPKSGYEGSTPSGDASVFSRMDREDLVWLSGLLEGEGCFQPGPPSRQTCPSISLQMADEDIVARAAMLCGGYKYQKRPPRKAGWKPMFYLYVRGYNAVMIMQSLHGLMGIRRKVQIDKAIASYDFSLRRNQYDDWDNEKLLKARETMSLRTMAKLFNRSAETIRRQLKKIEYAA